jgi:hypothetical protein
MEKINTIKSLCKLCLQLKGMWPESEYFVVGERELHGGKVLAA